MRREERQSQSLRESSEERPEAAAANQPADDMETYPGAESKKRATPEAQPYRASVAAKRMYDQATERMDRTAEAGEVKEEPESSTPTKSPDSEQALQRFEARS